MLEVRVTVYNLQVANEKKRSGWGKKTEKTASTEGNIVMFSDNMHKDIKEGHKRSYRSTETATRTRMKTHDAKITLMTKPMDKTAEKK